MQPSCQSLQEGGEGDEEREYKTEVQGCSASAEMSWSHWSVSETRCREH